MNPILSQSRVWHTYALKDPRTGAVRYVGTTVNFQQRINRHFGRTHHGRRTAWLAELRQHGLRPDVVVLETGTGLQEQAASERRWVEHYKPTGLLLNVSPGGQGLIPLDRTPVTEDDLHAEMEKMRNFPC